MTTGSKLYTFEEKLLFSPICETELRRRRRLVCSAECAARAGRWPWRLSERLKAFAERVKRFVAE